MEPSGRSEQQGTRVMALHALAYCERLFYLEEVEGLRVADAAVYAGRALHAAALQEEQASGRREFDVASATLGLRGRVDALRLVDGAWVPYELKRGRPPRREPGRPQVWPSDRLQIVAYALLLEEATGTRVPEGRIRYEGGHVTVRVPIDEAARSEVTKALARAEELRRETARPPVTENERLCLRCSLAPVCLPEEERLARKSDHEAVRLFPPERAGTVVYLTDPRTRLGRAGDGLVLHGAEGSDDQRLPAADVEAVVVYGPVQVSTQAIHFCVAAGIPIHWLTSSGHYVTGMSGPGSVHRRIRQYQALIDSTVCLQLARRLVLARAEGQLRYVLRATRGAPRPQSVEDGLAQMRQALLLAGKAETVDTLRGAEGLAARSYFAILPGLLADDVADELRPEGRSRRPPADRFNAILSFGYGLLYQRMLQAILTVGLEPSFGFYHTPRSSAYPLVLDLMELFRTPLWDVAAVGSVNRLQWDADLDFDVTPGQVWLSSVGRRKAITLFEQRLKESWKHPVTGYSLSYERTLELEVRLLEKEWTGTPGLFARARLR